MGNSEVVLQIRSELPAAEREIGKVETSCLDRNDFECFSDFLQRKQLHREQTPMNTQRDVVAMLPISHFAELRWHLVLISTISTQ